MFILISVEKKTIGIYGLRCRATGKWYVGQSTDVHGRWYDYSILKAKKQPKLFRALLKYGYEGFEKVLIETCDHVEWILDYREMYWIRHYNSVEDGYNLREGGNGGKHSEETKEKLRRINLGKKMSLDTIRKMLARPPHTEEAKAKMRLAASGRHHSEETKAKMRQAQLLRHAERPQVRTPEWSAKISAGLKRRYAENRM